MRPCSLHASRGNSPDNISESSASFHENELIQTPQPPSMPPPPMPTMLSQGQQPHLYGGHQGSSSSSSSVVPPSSWMYANRDSVRESWFSSGSSLDHHHLQQQQQQHHVLYHHHGHHRQRPQPQVSSGGTSDASNKSIASSSQQNFSKSSQTLPRNTVILYFLMFILSCPHHKVFLSVYSKVVSSIKPSKAKAKKRGPCQESLARVPVEQYHARNPGVLVVLEKASVVDLVVLQPCKGRGHLKVMISKGLLQCHVIIVHWVLKKGP